MPLLNKIIIIFIIMTVKVFSSSTHENHFSFSHIPLLKTALTFSDMPFDNVQTNMQVSSELSSYRKVYQNIYNQGGIKSFWNGTVFRISASLIRNTYQFYFFMQVPRWVEAQLGNSKNLSNAAIAFSIGATDILFTNWGELHKVRKMTANPYQSSFKLKFVDNFTRGSVPAFNVSFLSWFIFLQTEERLRNNLRAKQPDQKLNFKHFIIIGALTGLADSLWTLPFQNIKNNQQSAYSSSNSFRNIVALIYNKKGLRGFYSGFLMDVLRSLIFSSFDSWVRELTEKGNNNTKSLKNIF